jgi:hypothetical protein
LVVSFSFDLMAVLKDNFVSQLHFSFIPDIRSNELQCYRIYLLLPYTHPFSFIPAPFFLSPSPFSNCRSCASAAGPRQGWGGDGRKGGRGGEGGKNPSPCHLQYTFIYCTIWAYNLFIFCPLASSKMVQSENPSAQLSFVIDLTCEILGRKNVWALIV